MPLSRTSEPSKTATSSSSSSSSPSSSSSSSPWLLNESHEPHRRLNPVRLSACADSQSSEKSPRPEARCSSTLPYAISKWPEQNAASASSAEPPRKSKLSTKSESESAIAKTSPHEVRRKLSLLEEKRAIFQRRLFETTRDTDSGETVIAVSVDDDDKSTATKEAEARKKDEGRTKKRARHISVKKFDTFSTFEGTFDEETGVGYLAGIEEDYTESYDRQHDSYVAAMGPMMGDSAEKSKVVSQDSMVRNNRLRHRSFFAIPFHFFRPDAHLPDNNHSDDIIRLFVCRIFTHLFVLLDESRSTIVPVTMEI